MKYKSEFLSFLESFSKSDPVLVEAVKTGFHACFEGGIFPMGTGQAFDESQKIKLSTPEKNQIKRSLQSITTYHNSLSEIVEAVKLALTHTVVTSMVSGGEIWSGTFNGALSMGETYRGTIGLAVGDKIVANSMLVLNIYKMDGGQGKTYEVNVYLS